MIESLLSEKRQVRLTKLLQKLTDEERQQTDLVKLGQRQEYIQGDPFGVWSSWAGNVYYLTDLRMVRILSLPGSSCSRLI